MLTYIISDAKDAGRPLDVGVAMSEEALEGLPAPMEMTGKGERPGPLSCGSFPGNT